MNKNILYVLILILVLSACTPSESQVATSAPETELALPTDTPQPSQTPLPTATIIPTITATATLTLTPTPDLRVIDADPRLMLLSVEDIPEDSGYFSTGDIPHRNWVITRDYGDEIASDYLESSGRVDGWRRSFKTYSKLPNLAEEVMINIVIFSTVDMIDSTKVYHMGTYEITQMVIEGVSACPQMSSSQEIKPIDIGENANLCYIHLEIYGVGFIDYYNVYGSYRNILYSVTIEGPENTLSEDIVIDLAKLLVRKIKSFPLVEEVTYTPQ
jgi:hypothetical protein